MIKSNLVYGESEADKASLAPSNCLSFEYPLPLMRQTSRGLTSLLPPTTFLRIKKCNRQAEIIRIRIANNILQLGPSPTASINACPHRKSPSATCPAPDNSPSSAEDSHTSDAVAIFRGAPQYLFFRLLGASKNRPAGGLLAYSSRCRQYP